MFGSSSAVLESVVLTAGSNSASLAKARRNVKSFNKISQKLFWSWRACIGGIIEELLDCFLDPESCYFSWVGNIVIFFKFLNIRVSLSFDLFIWSTIKKNSALRVDFFEIIFRSVESISLLRVVREQGFNHTFNNITLFSTGSLSLVKVSSICLEGICFIHTDWFCTTDAAKSALSGRILLVCFVSEWNKCIEIYRCGLTLTLSFLFYLNRGLFSSNSNFCL